MSRDVSIDELVEKSERSLAAAEMLIERGDFDFAASRIYYAMFYMAEALLARKGRSYSSHAAVISALHTEFVKTGEIPRGMHAAFHRAFGLRQQGDYMSGMAITEEATRDILESAREFVSFAKDLLD